MGTGRGSGTHPKQTAAIMTCFEPVVENGRILVHGDVNSTLAAASPSGKLGLPIADVKAPSLIDRSMYNACRDQSGW
jgi:UDP-N-acetylglucosamine 2-epimerase (non-hydrolysing)